MTTRRRRPLKLFESPWVRTRVRPRTAQQADGADRPPFSRALSLPAASRASRHVVALFAPPGRVPCVPPSPRSPRFSRPRPLRPSTTSLSRVPVGRCPRVLPPRRSSQFSRPRTVRPSTTSRCASRSRGPQGCTHGRTAERGSRERTAARG
jgi:hypothetical protein